jgi:spermidine synthase
LRNDNLIPKPLSIYSGTFLIAFSTLALEVTLARLLSVVSFYHLAFFAVSTAMLGMTAGAVTVYLKPNWFPAPGPCGGMNAGAKLQKSAATACILYAISVPVSLAVISLVPMGLVLSLTKVLIFLLITAACSLPFYFSGVVLSVVLTKYDLPIGKLYASDLIGASLGCLFVLGGLEIFDAPSLLIVCGAIGMISMFFFAHKISSPHLKWVGCFILFSLLLASSVNFFTDNSIRPLYVKGIREYRSDFIYEKWNSFSRVAVYKGWEGFPENWGPSPVMPPDSRAYTYLMHIDGEAGTFLSRFSNLNDISHLRYDITNIAYYLREGDSSACIIGVGAGKDIQSAILFGCRRILGIDVNPIFIDLLKNKFRTDAGIAARKDVELVVDEARSYLSGSDEKFTMIQMALLDTWAATGAGAYTLTENTLYTVEAWKVILSHLSDNGLFTVSRWYSPNNLGETGRMLSLAVTSLLEAGAGQPSKHIAMVTIGKLSTLVVSKGPMSERDVLKLRQTASALRYDLVITPDEPPSNETLRSIVHAETADELHRVISDEPLNYEPPTDENPYFFNMLRLSHLKEAFSNEEGVARGNLIASFTLIVLILSLLILCVLTIVVPLLFLPRASGRGEMEESGNLRQASARGENLVETRDFSRKLSNSRSFFHSLLPAALYFSLIGAGFMFVEMGLLQRLSVFLGHPVYALGILLFTIILSAGLGSYFSECFPLTQSPWKYIFPAFTALLVFAMRFLVSTMVEGMITQPIIIKIISSVAVILPLGFLMGFFFPTGMKLVKTRLGLQTPWFWALNGIFGVLCSALAVFNAIYFGISVNFYIAAICYGITSMSITNLSSQWRF